MSVLRNEKGVEALVVVALRTDVAEIQMRLAEILCEAGGATDPEAQVWAKPVAELVAGDLDRLAAVIGWDSVKRLQVGDVVKGEQQ